MSTVSFCVGTGRCGTTFLAELAGLEPTVAASHERLRLAATFHMYCKWYGIDVDPEGFLRDREEAVASDLERHAVSFESSALLSHSIAELSERFHARFLLLVRSPHETVASFAARGWFRDPIAWNDASKPPTIREGVEPRHFFGRNLPRGADFARWRDLGQIGKLGWFWQARNRAILDQFRELPPSRCAIVRLEELSYETYVEVARFLGWQVSISRERFVILAEHRPNAGPNAPIAPATWSALDRAELDAEVGALARALGYERSTDDHPALAEPRLDVTLISARRAERDVRDRP
jgi:hypothetical protein